MDTAPVVTTITLPPPTPPPPPPPLPPPLAPPPPHASPLGGPFKRTDLRRSKMRSFNWDAIPRHSVLGKRNVWTAQGNLKSNDLDTKDMEKLFSHSEHRKDWKKVRKNVCGLSQTITESENVSILNSKKSMNIGILLKQFKRPAIDIVEAIRNGNLCFSSGNLRELSKLLPDDMESHKLTSFNGDLAQLNEADRFMVMLVQVTGYEVRLKSLLLREEFFPFIEDIKHSIAVMTTAANELLACDDLHSIIKLVLEIGNYMNAGGYAGDAIGFRMTSLLKLVDTKANEPGMNLMHYVSMRAQQINDVLLRFPEQLQHVGFAARIQKQEVEMDFERELEKISQAKADASEQPDLQDQMEEFLQMADMRLADVATSIDELDTLSKSVAEYFCEDPATFKLEECCSIFHSFCKSFERATQDNRDREAAETHKRKQREREELAMTAKRRHACLDQGGTDNATTIESVLTSFLSQRAPRRRSGRVLPVMDSPVKLDKNDRSHVEERKASEDLDSPAETKDLANISEKPEPESVCKKEEVDDALRDCAASNDEILRENGGSQDEGTRHTSVASEKEGVKENGGVDEEEEADQMPELACKVLRFQDCVTGLTENSTPDRTRAHTVCTSTPTQRGIKEVDLSVQNGGGLGSPWTILSPRISPRNTPHRRHSFNLSRVDILDDGVWALPDTPVRGKHQHFAKICSVRQSDVEEAAPTPVFCLKVSSERIPEQGKIGRSASLPDEKGSAPNFKLGQIFQRRIGQDLTSDKRHEPLALVTFFRRLGERNRAGTFS